MKSFWNFLKKNKLYGAINLVGLTLSMAFVLLLAVYIQRQLSTDSFQQNADRIYVEDPTIIYDTLTVAEANAICDTLCYNGVSEAKYYIEGYAVYADPYNIEYMNQTFFMVDDPAAPDSLFEAYTATPMKNKMAYPVLNGDKVRVFGRMKKYIDTKNNDRVQLEVMDPTVEFLE
ncbi:MAG: hypothetical protein K6G86_05470, partial [Bacteroidales bacterium]|nr:hypothetical protein [Bacteroidales bacterium]